MLTQNLKNIIKQYSLRHTIKPIHYIHTTQYNKYDIGLTIDYIGVTIN